MIAGSYTKTGYSVSQGCSASCFLCLWARMGKINESEGENQAQGEVKNVEKQNAWASMATRCCWWANDWGCLECMMLISLHSIAGSPTSTIKSCAKIFRKGDFSRQVNNFESDCPTLLKGRRKGAGKDFYNSPQMSVLKGTIASLTPAPPQSGRFK